MIRTSLIVLLLATFLSAQAKADLILEVQDSQFSVGGAGSVDLVIRSDGTDLLDSINYQLQISSVGSTVGTLQFVDPQSSAETSEADYVFFGNSAAYFALPGNAPAFNVLDGGDLTLTGLGETVSTNRLLARLEISHVLPGGSDLNLAAQDTFQISVNEVATSAFDPTFAAIALSTLGGTSTAASVPEPGSGILVLVGVGWAAAYRRARIPLVPLCS